MTFHRTDQNTADYTVCDMFYMILFIFVCMSEPLYTTMIVSQSDRARKKLCSECECEGAFYDGQLLKLEDEFMEEK